MSEILIYDDKGREFEIEYTYYPKQENYFDLLQNNWMKNDDANYEIDNVRVNLYTENKERSYNIDKYKLFEYLSEDTISEYIHENESII